MLKWLRKSQVGQAMVEMALVLPILVILISGILDFGWLCYNKVALNNAAREGARYAVIHYAPASSWAADTIDIMQSSYVGVTGASATVIDPYDSQIKAVMSANVPVLTGVGSTILGTKFVDMTGECIMRLEN